MPLDSPALPSTISLDAGLLTAAEVAQLLQLPRSTVYELARSGRLPCLRIGKAMRFYRGDLEAQLARLRRTA